MGRSMDTAVPSDRVLVRDGELQERVRAAQIKLGDDVGAVAIHRPDADEQLGGDLGRGVM